MKKYLVFLILPSLILAIWDRDTITVNKWRCPFYNDGRWGIDIGTTRDVAGGYWPYPLRNFYIFGGGPWIGCIAQGETLVTYGYNPNSGATEMVPTLCQYWHQGYSNPLDRIYKYPGDWPPPSDRFPMAPIIPLSDMDLWCCFSDSDPSYHDTNDTRPIGIDIALTVYGFNDFTAQDFFFLKYDLININNYLINDMYFGIVLDGDIGDATDELTGLILNKLFSIGSDTIRVKNSGLIYDYDNIETPRTEWEGGTPGAVAIRLLSAPFGLNLSAFKKFPIESDPVNDRQRYLAMAGYNWYQIPPQYVPFDSIDYNGGDKRFIMSCGPFNLLPCSTATFYYAVIGSPHGDSGEVGSKHDTTSLAQRCYWAEMVFMERLGIEEKEQSTLKVSHSTLEIYPNPAKSVIRVRCPLSGKEPANLKIFDVSGKLIGEVSTSKSAKEHNEEIRISLKGIKPGIYFCQLKGEKYKAIRKLVIIE